MAAVTSVGLVLGAGGITGAAFHAGALAALADVSGWDPREAALIVGTSAGSSIGATLRAGLSPADQLARATGAALSAEGVALTAHVPPLTDFPTRRPSGQWMPQAPHLLAGVIGWPLRRGRRLGTALTGLLPAGTIPTAPIGDRVRAISQHRWPERPLWICAVRLRDGRRVVFGRDPVDVPDVGIACEASSAIPGFFRPVKIGEDNFVDGGVHSPTNADLIAGLGLDVVVVVSPMSSSRSSFRPSLGSGGRMWWGLTLADELRAVRRDPALRVLTIQPTADDLAAMGVNPMDPRRRAATARQAYESVTARLAAPGQAGMVAVLTRA
jgi:NTE family protein